jgi:hypothetical protein
MIRIGSLHKKKACFIYMWGELNRFGRKKYKKWTRGKPTP